VKPAKIVVGPTTDEQAIANEKKAARAQRKKEGK